MYLIVPELSDFLVLHGRVIPDEVGGLILIPALDEVHLVDDYANLEKRNLTLDCIPLTELAMQ